MSENQNNGIIKSMLDNDLYAFTMQNAFIRLFPDLMVEYELIIRNDTKFPDGFDYELSKEIEKMKNLALTKDEKKFMLNKNDFLTHFYMDYIESYRYDPSEVMVYMTEDHKIKVKIRGYIHKVVLWNTPLLATISELYYKMTLKDNYPTERDFDKLQDDDIQKAVELKNNNCFFSEFGTRRRFSYENQKRVISILKDYGGTCFTGTSNPHFAMMFNLNCVGTMAHEYISLHAALYGYKMANKIAMENWSKVYNGDLGIALTDTFTSDEFLRTFDLKSSKLFDGVRQDSGDPFEYVDKFVKHYQDMKIDPMSKVIGFTNGLNVKTAISIKEYCIGKIKQFFGIGTFFTNDLKKLDIAPLNIVIKLTKVLVDGRWVGAVKLSDDYGKCTGKEDDVKQAKRELNITEITYTHNPAGNENDVAKPTYL